ncbi:MAG: chemotaxis protein CheV [Gammaproteobacteria bacterium]|nr:chemotaxis protein CheV [Gammaproteobacteria bacterium]
MAGVIDSVDQRTQLAGHNRLELLTFRLRGKQRFGINVFKVQEVLQCPALTQIPHSHPVVRGVATMRGKTIPVMDLSMAIGAGAIGDTSKCFMIVTEYNRSTQAFLVGAVERIVNLNWEEILPPPKGSGKDSYLTAVTRIDNELVEIIDVEKVLAEVTQASTEVSKEVTDSVESSLSEQHILVVDDSSVARNQIKRTLDQLGLQCTLATNGREALKMLQEWAETQDERLDRLAMVLSDVEMPEMDGYTLTIEIRKDSRLQKLYVLLHTSLSGTFNLAMVQKVGADKFVPKFKPDELAGEVLQRVREFVQSRANG